MGLLAELRCRPFQSVTKTGLYTVRMCSQLCVRTTVSCLYKAGLNIVLFYKAVWLNTAECLSKEPHQRALYSETDRLSMLPVWNGCLEMGGLY